MTEKTEQDIDANFAKWRDRSRDRTQTKWIARVLYAITAFGWLLFLYKISQTSEMAMRYSETTQSAMGTWILVLFLMSLACAATRVLQGVANRREKTIADTLIADLRGRLNGADAGQRSKIESQLRELGA